jgi:ADP-heptose:LPS heptosyltransferase
MALNLNTFRMREYFFKKKILIIKLGAVGDLLHAVNAFKAIKRFHKNDELCLLTSPPYADFCKKMGFFDRIYLDARPKLFDLKGWLDTLIFFKKSGFYKIYDLQMVDRTKIYSKFANKKTIWIGNNKDKVYGYEDDDVDEIHPILRFEKHFKKLKIPYNGFESLSFLSEPIKDFSLKKFCVLVPGASNAHNGEKIWPQQNFAEVAVFLAESGFIPVIVGGLESDFSQITKECPKAINLCGKTSIGNLIYLGERAFIAIGNDTGPMIALHSGGCKTLTLYSSIKNYLGGAVGPNSYTIQAVSLKKLRTSVVLSTLKEIFVKDFLSDS